MRIADVEDGPVTHREPSQRNARGAHSEPAARTIVRFATPDAERGGRLPDEPRW